MLAFTNPFSLLLTPLVFDFSLSPPREAHHYYTLLPGPVARDLRGLAAKNERKESCVGIKTSPHISSVFNFSFGFFATGRDAMRWGSRVGLARAP